MVETLHDTIPLEHAHTADHAIARVQARLDKLESLSALLSTEAPYPVERPPCELPPGFRLSIVIPVYNEQGTIRELLARVAALPVAKEIIVVDDASSDGTRRELQGIERAADVKVIYKEKNEGKGAALRDGFAKSSGDVVVVQDADLEYDPRDIFSLLPPIVRRETDVVYGSRFCCEKPQDPSLIHRLGNALLTTASNLLTGFALTDMETCYKAFRREVIQSLPIRQNRFGFEPEVTARLARRGHRIVEVPIRYNGRGFAEGKKIGLKDAASAFWCIFRYGLAE